MQKICLFHCFVLQVLQSDWPRRFWLISQETDFPKIWNLCKNMPNNINFHWRPNSGQNND